MKRYSFTRLCIKYLEAEASLHEQIHLEKWLKREPKRGIKFNEWIQVYRLQAVIFPAVKARLIKVSLSRIIRGLPPL